ncbi:MAG: creatininase family protein [Bacillota bacterium]
MSVASERHDLLRLTWREASDWVERDPVILIPIGSTECEGPHLPLGSDFLVSLRVAQVVARRTDSLVAPGVPCGISPGFVGFPGTISLHPNSLAAVTRDIVESLIRQGFRRFLAVANHGPNMPVVEAVARELMENHCETIVAAVWPAELTGQVATAMGIPSAGRGHGGDPATSIMLAVSPGDVRMDLAEADNPPVIGALKLKSSSTAEISGVPVRWFSKVHAWSRSGVTGDPLTSSAERGRVIFDKVCDMIADVVLYLKSMELGQGTSLLEAGQS